MCGGLNPTNVCIDESPYCAIYQACISHLQPN
jgi:hypothetical protein